MKKQLLSLGIILMAATQVGAQTVVVDTVSVGAGYANQKWYSLKNDEQGTQSKDNWDLGFEISGYTAAILGNVQKTDFTVYKAPYKISDYATIDTTGIRNWPKVYNSDTTWAIGAFNTGGNPSNPMDLGWGTYNTTTHIITGDSTYVIKLSATSYKKIKFIDLNSGVYSFEYANIDGTNAQAKTVTKSSFTGKNFIYFDMTTNTTVDREPASANWDLTFVKYMSYAPTIYAVTGILSNKGVTVAQANNVTAPATYTAYGSHTFTTTMNAIGHDWKSINMTTFQWDIPADTVYFVKAKDGDIWKLRFKSFGGSSGPTAGNTVFSKQNLTSGSVGIADVKGNIAASVIVFPNPASSVANLLFSAEGESTVAATITDLTGKTVASETINVSAGLNQHALNISNLQTGVYFIHLNGGSYSVTQKLIKY